MTKANHPVFRIFAVAMIFAVLTAGCFWINANLKKKKATAKLEKLIATSIEDGCDVVSAVAGFPTNDARGHGIGTRYFFRPYFTGRVLIECGVEPTKAYITRYYVSDAGLEWKLQSERISIFAPGESPPETPDRTKTSD